MYLSKLDLNEKKNFINLAALVAEANGIVEESEQFMLDMYCAEMQMEEDVECDKEFDAVIAELKNSAQDIKNIIVFELIGLCLTDGDYDNDERENIKKIADELGVAADKLAIFEKDLSLYADLVGAMSEHVLLQLMFFE